MKKSVAALAGSGDWGQIKSHAPAPAPPLLDAKGRAVPPDVRAIVAKMDSAKEKTPNVV